MFYNDYEDGTKTCSYVKLPSSKVQEMCEYTIKSIKQARQRAVDKLIKETKEDIINSFWHKFWKKPVPTDQEVLNRIENGEFHFIPETIFIEIRYDYSFQVAVKLSKACQYADEINISVEDFYKLWKKPTNQ